MYNDILVAVDSSPTAERALQHATQLAQALNARLTILSVVVPLPSFAYRAGVDVSSLQAEAEREAQDLVRDAAAGVPDDVSVTTRIRHGHAGYEIVRQVEENGHDLVVLGSRGRGRLASALLGTVGGDVHFHLHAPLLVVHPDADPDADSQASAA